MTIYLNERELYDLECIITGVFAPLTGFLKRDDYISVIRTMHLAENGPLWALPITLYTEEPGTLMQEAKIIDLRSANGELVARLHDVEFYRPMIEERKVYGKNVHPEVLKLISKINKGWYIGGRVEAVKTIFHSDFRNHRRTPAEMRHLFTQLKDYEYKNVIAFQTRNPMHRAHFHITQLALKQVPNAMLLIHPAVGPTRIGDIDYFTRVKTYEALLPLYNGNAMLSLAPLAMRMAGPREAVHHAIIRQNYGCTHFIIGRDHAGLGEEFYELYEAQELALSLQDELKIKIIAIKDIPDFNGLQLTGTRQRAILKSGEQLPKEFTFPEVAKALQRWYALRMQSKKGLCLYFYGLSAAGKTTLATLTTSYIKESTGREVTMLDGDVVRQNISAGLGFSSKDRSENIRRTGWVASEIVKHGGVVICANMAPYAKDRRYNRQLISSKGNYVEIFVDTPLHICKKRDPKNLYAKAANGDLPNFVNKIERGVPDLTLEPDGVLNQMREIRRFLNELL
jgi:sulfate adenylyltransferase